MTERKEGSAFDSLLPSEDDAWLARASEAGEIGLWRWQADEGSVRLSEGGRTLLGLGASAAELNCEDVLAMVDARDREGLHAALAEALDTEHAILHEARLDDASANRTRWICITGRITARDAEGRACVLSGAFQDITQRHLDQERAWLLNRELAHRIKNLFSVVNSIASVSAENRPEVQNFVSIFQARVNSLAAAQELLRDQQTHAMPLGLLAETVLAPLAVLPRIAIEADATPIGSYDAQTLVLVLHELATNAIKHGALSTSSGRVGLSFALTGNDPNNTEIVMVWQEFGGPPVLTPQSKGFGVTLLERLAKHQESEGPVVDWRPGGLSCRIKFRMLAP